MGAKQMILELQIFFAWLSWRMTPEPYLNWQFEREYRRLVRLRGK